MPHSIQAQCPCCKAGVDVRRIRRTVSLLPFDGMIVDPTQGREESFLQILAHYPGMYQWACDDCINGKKAILGRPARQFYTFQHPWDTAAPYFAYFDQTFACRQCREDFVFSKEEQQYWYEELQFVVYARPVHCTTCRKAIREAKDRNTELSDLLRDGAPQDAGKLRRIAEIYAQMGKPDKEKAYLRAAKNLEKRSI